MSGKQAVKGDLIAGFRDQKLANAVVPCPDHLPNLLVSKITFHDNQVVDKDTLGPFPKPEWDMERLADEQAPICYVRAATVTLTVELLVLGTRTYAGSVTIHGAGRFADQDVEWSQDVTLSPGDTTATITAVASSIPLPDRVACYDPVSIVWEARPPGKARTAAGTSQHVIHALLGAPTTTVYWTLIDISCRWGSGATTDAALVAKVFPAFKTLRLTRKRDSIGLTYWRPGLNWADMRRCQAFSTYLLLAGVHGRGQCGSWAEFLVDMCRDHGVQAQKIRILVASQNASLEQRQANGFLVKNWLYVTPPDPSPEHFTHTIGVNCLDQPGVPGQRNPDPPPTFFNHFIAKILGNYYDPAYGGGPFADQHAWELASVAGLRTGATYPGLAGFTGSQKNVMVFSDAEMVDPMYNHLIPEAD